MKRLTTAEAASILGVSADTVREYAKKRYLTPSTISGRFGDGQRMYFDQGEVEALASGGAVAAQAYRDAKGNIPPMRKVKGRRRTVAQ